VLAGVEEAAELSVADDEPVLVDDDPAFDDVVDDDVDVVVLGLDVATTTYAVEAWFHVAEVTGLDGSTEKRPTPVSQQLFE
jgi:hypothetical protein